MGGDKVMRLLWHSHGTRMAAPSPRHWRNAWQKHGLLSAVCVLLSALTATTLPPSQRSCSTRDKASNWKLDYRDLLDAQIESLKLLDWHRQQIERIEREKAARAPRLEAYRVRP